MSADAIHEEIFTKGAEQFGPVLRNAASDPLKWNDAIGAAMKFSLLERNSEKLLAVHRMVQAVVKARMSAKERTQWVNQLVSAVRAAFPPVKSTDWNRGKGMRTQLDNVILQLQANQGSYIEATILFQHRLDRTLDEM